METLSLKALANKVLQRNRTGNLQETQVSEQGNLEGEKFPKVSGMKDEAGNIAPTEREPLTEAEQDTFVERAAIIEYDAGLPRDQAEPCGKQIPPKGTCRGYSMKLYKPSMDLQPYCLKARKWCHSVNPDKQTSRPTITSRLQTFTERKQG